MDGCEQEAQIEAALEEAGVDLIVLARYMQIFSEDFCSRHAMHTINIHHSFLPAFEGLLINNVSGAYHWCLEMLAGHGAVRGSPWMMMNAQVQSRTTEHTRAA